MEEEAVMRLHAVIASKEVVDIKDSTKITPIKLLKDSTIPLEGTLCYLKRLKSNCEEITLQWNRKPLKPLLSSLILQNLASPTVSRNSSAKRKRKLKKISHALT